jgi:hypothetical protein
MKPHFKLNKIIVISVIILLVLCLILLLVTGKKESVPVPVNRLQKNAPQGSSIVSNDSLRNAAVLPTPNLSGAGPSVTSQAISNTKSHRSRRETLEVRTDTANDTSAIEDTTAEATFDTTAESAEAAARASLSAGCAGDTAAPWAYPDPSGGLHRKEISVVFASTKPCTIEWKTDSASPWVVYKGESIPVTKSTTLYFQAHDTCGRIMQPRQEAYEIRPQETERHCPEGMEYIDIGTNKFCIDKYEWPDKKGVAPRSFVSIYQAMDSCVSAGKHLCTSDEWTLACTGPYGWHYPYGAAYEPHACVTQDTCARPSGKKVECRGYFDVYDMAGNLAEWTNTKSSRNPQFYNVKGGFWESGPRSGCFDVRYSYYPQNRHNPVGFRCCKEPQP